MINRINKNLTISLIAIFLFWFFLAKDNFFHMDDWEWVKLYEKGFWGMIMSPRDSEHFVPLAGTVFYIFFKLFGFSYLPFQLFNSLIHTLNSLILYKITKLETQNPKLSLAAALLFGFSSTAPDILVWANSFLINTAGFCFFLGSYLFLLYSKNKKPLYLVISLFALLASPRLQTLTSIAPFAIAVTAFLRMKKKQAMIPALFYVLVGLANIGTTFFSAPSALVSKTQLITPDLLTRVPLYIFWGIYKGTFLRLVTPDLYFLKNITHITQPIRIALAFLLPVVAIFFFGQIRLNKKVLYRQNTPTILSYLLLLSITYIMIAPFRVHNGLMQATIPRYTYTSVFFMIILLVVVYHSYFHKIGKIITIGFIGLVSLHLIANFNFNSNWHLNTEKDRMFTNDMQYLFSHNTEVFDLPVDGIWILRLSQLDTLLAPGRNIIFSNIPFNVSSSIYLKSDEVSKAIYGKLLTDYAVYNPPFHVPYSM